MPTATGTYQDPALALNARGKHWYFSMTSMGLEGGEATASAIENKLQRVLEATGMHTMMWERTDMHNKQVGSESESSHTEANLFKAAIVVHGLLRWGADVRGRTVQRDVFGLSVAPPHDVKPCA